MRFFDEIQGTKKRSGRMSADLAGKRVFVLSDNHGLSRAIEVSLASNHLQDIGYTWELGSKIGHPLPSDEFDLIIVALSSSGVEPTAMLARASMSQKVGQIPLLVISEKPPDAGSDNEVAHLGFPFDLDLLCDKVAEVLESRP
jgi:hypothetical protein